MNKIQITKSIKYIDQPIDITKLTSGGLIPKNMTREECKRILDDLFFGGGLI